MGFMKCEEMLLIECGHAMHNILSRDSLTLSKAKCIRHMQEVRYKWDLWAILPNRGSPIGS